MELISEYVSLAAAEGVGSNHHLFRDTLSRPRQTAVMMMRLIALFLFSLAPAPPRPPRPPRHPCHLCPNTILTIPVLIIILVIILIILVFLILTYRRTKGSDRQHCCNGIKARQNLDNLVFCYKCVAFAPQIS